jgi:hypothetical protein
MSGAGGNAAAAAYVVANRGLGSASAFATGGRGDQGASSGGANASSTTRSSVGSVFAAADSPGLAAGGPVSADALASIGAAGSPILVNAAPGQVVSDAMLTRGGSHVLGAMAATYGGQGETLTYHAQSSFTFATSFSPDLELTLFDNSFSGAGFDSLRLDITVNGVDHLYQFLTLAAAEQFFSGNTLDFGFFAGGTQTISLDYLVSASNPGDGFGFTYGLSAVPEPSTWGMMLIGFCGLGLAGARRARKPARMD